MNAGYTRCFICQKSQSWLGEHFGSTSSVVAVVAAALTFAQLVVSMQQNSSALDSAKNAQEALKKVQEESSRIQKVEGRLSTAESDWQEASHNAKEAFLKLKVLEVRLEELGAGRVKTITDAKAAAESARATYSNVLARLSATSPTFDTEEASTVTEKKCINILGLSNCIPVPRVETRRVTRPNMAYAPLKAEAEAASKALQDAESALEKALK
jgi:hypothetical protein